MARTKAKAPQQQQSIEQSPPEPRQEPQVLTLAPAAQPVSALVPQGPPSPDEVLAMADNQIKIRKGYVKLVSTFLRPQDVLVFGDEVYLPARPCQDILSWARIRVKPHWPVEEHHYNSPDGEFIEFVITATITDSGGREVDVMGNRSTRDEFFGISGKEYVCPECKGPLNRRFAREGDKWESNFCDKGGHGKVKPEAIVHYLPLCDVDIPSVRQAAVTNLWNKSLKAIGLMPTIQDLGEAGMDISKVKRVDFKSDNSKPSPKPSTPPAQSPPPSNQQKAAAPPTSAQTPPPASNPHLPKAAIPPMANAGDSRLLVGTLEEIRPGDTVPKDKVGNPTGKPGRPFLGLIINGTKVTCFDNKELTLDTKQPPTTKHAFTLLAENVGMRVELRVKQSGKWENVTAFQRIGDWEWDAGGVPVLRREPVQDSFGSQFVADDSDIPF